MASSDRALLDRWINHRDAEAFAEIVSAYSGMVFATCRRILGNAADAEDITQECFLRLSRGDTAIHSSLGGWLHVLATHRCLDFIRSQTSRRKREAEHAQTPVAEGDVGWEEIREVVDEAIAELPFGLREPLVQHFFAGANHDEIAAELGVTRSAVTHRIGKAFSTRPKAREIAEQWRTGGGEYCFTTTPARADEMLTTEQFRIAFPTLDYRKRREPGKAQAAIPGCRVDRFIVGNYLRENAAVNTFKDVLREFSVSLTGRKEELVEKLARLAAKEYEEKAPELDAYFGENRFVRIKGGSHESGRPFPVLENHMLRHMLLAMYVQKHLRGNTVLEAGYRNDTFDTLDLARALIQRNITLNGCYLPVG